MKLWWSVPLLLITGCARLGSVPVHSFDEINTMNGTQLAELRATYAVREPPTDEAAQAEDYADANGYLRVIRARACDQHPEWPKEHHQSIVGGRIEEGFSTSEVWWSWGPPDQGYSNDYPVAGYLHWYYSPGMYHTFKYELVFQDGFLIWYTKLEH